MSNKDMQELISTIRTTIPSTIASNLVGFQPIHLNVGSFYDQNVETSVERMLRVDFGGVDKDVIITMLKEKFPENFV